MSEEEKIKIAVDLAKQGIDLEEEFKKVDLITLLRTFKKEGDT